MENILLFFQDHFPVLFSHTYIFLFLGAAIEGITTLVVGGFLVSTHSIKFFPAFLAFALGHALNGYLWYTVGYYAGAKPIDRWGRNQDQSRKIIERVEHYFHRYSGRAIFFTKFTFSLTIATLIMAGSLKYDLRKFSLYNVLGSICWAFFAMSIGYFFGQGYKLLFEYAKDVAFFVLFLGGAIVLVFIIKNVFRSAFIQSLIMSEKVQELSNSIREHIDKFLTNKTNNDDRG